nr:Laminin G domain containing protein [Haemonchus contortus]
MSTLSVTDYLYLGGTPTGVNTRSPIEPFRGCIKSVRLGSDEMDLYASYASKGVRNACPLGTVNTVSILSDRSTAVFENITASNEMDVSLRFKTRRSTGTLLTIQSDEDDLLSLKIEDGVLVATAGDDKVSLELASAADEQWHYVSVRKTKEILRVDVDDLHSKEERRANGDDVAPGEMARILFGRHDTASFVGCVGDVSYNGELLDFAKAKIHEVSLTGCSLAADVVKTTVSTTSESVPTTLEAPANLLITTEVMTTVAPTEAETVADGACALGLDPRPPKDEVDGTRFGLQPNSRLEYEVMPDSFDKSGTFSLQIRPSALNGVIMFAANDKHTDHIGLFLLNGRLVLSFDTGSGQTIIRSNRSILNGEWHSVKASRRGSEGLLVVDDESTEAVVSAGTDAIDTQPPLYLGGIPNELASYARTIVPGVRTEFGGCIREFKLNDKKFDTVARDHGIGECSVRTESGLYFGKEGGYAILRKEFEVGKSFSAELEVRPRTQNGVLFSVGVIEYLTVQLLNGNVKFTVNSGSGDESLIYTPPTANTICDGHWHSIKIMKKKNLMTLTVDGKSNLNIMKRGKKHETVTKDPIYLGGVPESVVSKGLETREPYVGCMRIMNLGGGKKDKMRRKKQLDVSMLDIYGNVNKQECPLN